MDSAYLSIDGSIAFNAINHAPLIAIHGIRFAVIARVRRSCPPKRESFRENYPRLSNGISTLVRRIRRSAKLYEEMIEKIKSDLKML